MHERLMQLRGKVFGRMRTILGKVPEEMDVTLQIDKDLYVEAKFDTEADRGRDGGFLLPGLHRKVLERAGILRRSGGDIEWIMAVYNEQNVTSEKFEDFDGERRIIPND